MSSPNRSPHPCIARRCGHGTEAHVRTPELESQGETVLWCAACRRHEVRAVRWRWQARRVVPPMDRALPTSAF